MSFVGQLSQFRLSDLLQMIATTGKTGKLSLHRRDGRGLVVFRRGKIIYTASTTLPHETLGSALIGEGLVSAEDLQRAIDLQTAAEEPVRLGQILTHLDLVGDDDLERVIGRQVEKVISELMGWDDAFFKFELLEIPEGGEVEVAVDAQDYLLEKGVGTDQVLLSIAVKLDELERDRQTEGLSAERARVEPEASDEPAPTRSQAAAAADLSPLNDLRREVRSPEFTGEITSQILGYARGLFERGVLFMAGERQFDGVGGFGAKLSKSDPTATIRAREISLPATQPSILREVAERGETHRGPLPFLPMTQRLLQQLGGGDPGEAAVLPLAVNGRVMLLLYGDNLPLDTPIGSLAELELLLQQLGLVMEKQMLARRVSEVEMMRQLLDQA